MSIWVTPLPSPEGVVIKAIEVTVMNNYEKKKHERFSPVSSEMNIAGTTSCTGQYNIRDGVMVLSLYRSVFLTYVLSSPND